MNCHEFERWLDEGSPEAHRADALAHARACSRCAASLRAADEIEALLAAAPAVREGFADRVMLRVGATAQLSPRASRLELLQLTPAIPWWVRVTLEPACILSLMLVAVLVWRGNALFALAATTAAHVGSWLTVTASSGAGAPWSHPVVLTCIVLGAAPLAFMASQQISHWSESLVGPRHLRLRAH